VNWWLYRVFTQITASYSNVVFGGTASKELKDIKTEISIKKTTKQLNEKCKRKLLKSCHIA
jgi:hypothetical protein